MNFIWKHDRRFNAYASYFKQRFGSRIQKVSIDAGFTCPNRDGTSGTGGCTFCNNDTFNPSYCTPDKSITQQINEGLEFHRKRYKGTTGFLAYFQAYSNTYAPLSELTKMYDEALKVPGIRGLIIGTRPDCMDEEKLNYFRELSASHYIVIEYGIESCYDKTLKRINRGHTFSQTEDMIKRTNEKNIRTGGHIIFGLPGESVEEMLVQSRIISQLPLNSIKFHQLQIIKGTYMEQEYKTNPKDFVVFDLEQYLDFCVRFTEQLNPEILIERIAGEAPPAFIASNMIWKKRYDQILVQFEKKLEELDTWQGKKYTSITD